MSTRQTEHPIHPQFTARWSPRAYTGEAIPEAQLLGILEAARWAPSAFNAQPWRFIWARRDTPAFAALLGSAVEANQVWMRQAAALVLVVSQTRWLPPGKAEKADLGSHAFDAGAAWAYLALQADLAGWPAHAAGGFDRAQARAVTALPEDFVPQALVAIGRRGDKSSLPEALQAREQPNGRHPLAAIAAEGRFNFG